MAGATGVIEATISGWQVGYQIPRGCVLKFGIFQAVRDAQDQILQGVERSNDSINNSNPAHLI